MSHAELGHILLLQLDCHPDQLPLLKDCATPRGPWGDRTVELTALRWPADPGCPLAASTPTVVNWRDCHTLVLLFRWP